MDNLVEKIENPLESEPKSKAVAVVYVAVIIFTAAFALFWAWIMFMSLKQSFKLEMNMNLIYDKAVLLVFPELGANKTIFSPPVAKLLSLFLIYGGFSLSLWTLLRFRYYIANYDAYKTKKESGIKLVRSAFFTFFITSIYGLFLHAIKYFINIDADNSVFVNWVSGCSFSLIVVAGILVFCKLMRKYPKIINKEMILYLVFGVLTTFVNVISFNLFRTKLGMALYLSNGIAWVLAVAFAYFGNKLFVFNSKTVGLLATLKEAGLFVGARIASLVVDMILIGLFIDLIGLGDGLSKLLVNIVIMIINYIFSKLFIFKAPQAGGKH